MNQIQKNWIAGFIDGDGSFALEKLETDMQKLRS
jgi:hypothetical protein